MATKAVLNTNTPITQLQELCVAQKSPHPVYTFTGEETDGTNPSAKVFMTSVTALGFNASGIGRSKKDSKHDAAYKLLKILFQSGLSNVNVDDEEHYLSVLSSDKVTEVRDICVQRNFDMPSFECVRSSGPSHAPEFEFECRIGTIVRRGIHKTKKGAKQAACNEMLKTLQAMPVEDSGMQIQSLDQAAKMDMEEDEHIIRTYRELVNSDIKKKLGVKITDRHRFFEEMEPDKIQSARRVFIDELLDVEDKCTSIPKSLGLKFEMKRENSDLVSITGKKLYTFELLNTEYDCFIFGEGDAFYQRIFDYFTNMLNFK